MLLGAAVAALGATAAAQSVVERFSGSGPGSTDDFTVDGPWLLNWNVTSEFPMLAHLELHLYEEPSGRFAGIAVNYTGVGSGQKVVAEGGRYRIVVAGRAMSWAVEIEKARREVADLLKSDPELSRMQILPPDTGLTPDTVRSIRSWEPEDDSTLIVRTDDGRSFRITFYDGEPCPGLADAQNVFFVTSSARAQTFNAILLEQGVRCYIGQVRTVVQ
jgi:hypothetical protein